MTNHVSMCITLLAIANILGVISNAMLFDKIEALEAYHSEGSNQ